MSSSDPAGADRIYHFISDPDHKENLSGRVRAACMNCRRKKIKCSGEINCRTCQERGLICEGPPERKRPQRSLDLLNTRDAVGKPRQDSSSSNQTNQSPTTSSRQQSFSSSSAATDRRRSSTQRPVAALMSKDSNDSSDSGYFSPRLETIPSSHPEPNSFDGVGKFPTSSGVRSDWAFQKAPTSAASYTPTDQSQVDMNGRDESPRMSAQQQMWWAKQNAGAQSSAPVFSDLMSTANLLEEQALSLRQLAFHQASEQQYENMSQDSLPQSASDLSSSGRHNGLMSNTQTQGTMDSMNMMFSGGESTNGMTSQMGNVYQQGWWHDSNDVNSPTTNPGMQFRSVSYSQSPIQNMSDETWQRASMYVQQQQQQQQQQQSQQRQQYNSSTSPQLPSRQARPGQSARQQTVPTSGSMQMFSWAS